MKTYTTKCNGDAHCTVRVGYGPVGGFDPIRDFPTRTDADRWVADQKAEDAKEEEPSMTQHPKRPRDPNQSAKLIVDLATGGVTGLDVVTDDLHKDPAAVELGRRGGLKGGNARAARLTPEQRADIARNAAAKRWGKT